MITPRPSVGPSIRPFTPLNDFSSETPGPNFFKLFTKGKKLKITMKFSINLNLKTLRLLNCLHMFFSTLTKDKLID